MPDLLTHTLLHVALPAGRLRRPEVAVFAFGGVLPDLCSRVPSMVIPRAARLVGATADLDWLVAGFHALHFPLGYAACVLAIVAAAPERFLGPVPRRRVGWLLLAGGLTHLATDLLQDHLRPSYHYLYPLSDRTLDIGLVPPELGFVSWPLLLPLAWLAWRRAER